MVSIARARENPQQPGLQPGPLSLPMNLTDLHGRVVSYLRLSVTDCCNLRCGYCMPPGGITRSEQSQLLSFEELERIASIAVSLGLDKIRITGGEPLIRRGVIPFLGRLSLLPGLNFLVLTTNGILLAELATDLKGAGVERLNVSLDSLKPETFSAITRGGELAAVLRGLDAAVKAGLPHPKLNMVVMKGVNDHEVVDFALLARERGCTVRFIEYMPAGRVEGWQSQFLPAEEILRRIADRFELRPVSDGPTAGPSRSFRFADAPGGIGIISAVSGHFCAGCNRIRVTAQGLARSCLFADDQLDLKPLLRGTSQEELAEALRRFVMAKPGAHRMTPHESHHTPFTMSGIGG